MGGWQRFFGSSWALPQPVRDTVQAQGRTLAFCSEVQGASQWDREVRGWGRGEQRAEPDSRAVAARPRSSASHTHRKDTVLRTERCIAHCPHLDTFFLSCPDACLVQEVCLDTFPQPDHHTSGDSHICQHQQQRWAGNSRSTS